MSDIDDLLEEEGIEKDTLEAAIALARLVADETGMCCENLGRFVWACYQQLENDENE